MGHQDDFKRLSAYATQKSVPRRGTAALTRQLPALGLVPIRVAGDQRIQALAVGPLDGYPVIEVIHDPYRHADGDFAVVSAYVERLISQEPWQIWLPDRAALRACGLEGLRNRRNPAVPPARQAMARAFNATFRMWERPGQQVVAVATETLAEHLVTGQSPTEDAHLGARLAWDNPQPGLSPATISEGRRAQGGPSLLPFADDERVETIRTKAFKGVVTPAQLLELDSLLVAGALHSWQVLAEAHAVYKRLSIPDLPGLETLTHRSIRDFAWMYNVSPAFGASQRATLQEFRLREYLHDVFEDINARGDPIERERLRQEGRVLRAMVLRAARGSSKERRPCRIVLSTSQEVRRFRVGTKLKSGDNTVEGRVEAIRYSADRVLFIIHVTRGMTSARKLAPGSVLDWFDTVVFPFSLWMKRGK